MRVWMTIIAAGLQAAVLAYMAGEREAVLAHGAEIWLRTVPVDPRDLFRGDYVRLRYEASTVPRERWAESLARRGTPRRGRRVYALLTAPDEDGLSEVRLLTDERPEEPPFLRGRIEHADSSTASVRYGIEAYFVQQGAGLALERQGNREGIRVPLEMALAVGTNGIAVLRGHRQCPLGLGIELERRAAAPNRPETMTGLVTLRLMNASDRPLAVVDPPGGRAFRLCPESQWQTNPWLWVHRDAPPPPVTDGDVRVLTPGETRTVRIDLNDPAWFVEAPGGHGPRPVTGIEDWNARFRLVYEPPSRPACAGLRMPP